MIVNLDAYQQAALAKHLQAKVRPELKNKVGFYNLRASRTVYEKLNAKDVHHTKDIWWFWTGDKFDASREESQYAAPEKMVSPDNMVNFFKDKNSLLCCRPVNVYGWGTGRPSSRYADRAFLLEFASEL